MEYERKKLKGSPLKIAILNYLTEPLYTMPSLSTVESIYEILSYEEWDIQEIKNCLGNMCRELLVEKTGYGKNATYTIMYLGRAYLEETTG